LFCSKITKKIGETVENAEYGNYKMEAFN